MIKDATLTEILESLYKCIETLYIEDKDDDFAQYLAGNIIAIHEQIEIELLERAISC